MTSLPEGARAFSTSALELPTDAAEPLPIQGYDSRRLRELAGARDTSLSRATALRVFAPETEPGETLVLKVRERAEVVSATHSFLLPPVMLELQLPFELPGEEEARNARFNFVDGEYFVGRQHLPMIRWILEGRQGAGPI